MIPRLSDSRSWIVIFPEWPNCLVFDGQIAILPEEPIHASTKISHAKPDTNRLRSDDPLVALPPRRAGADGGEGARQCDRRVAVVWRGSLQHQVCAPRSDTKSLRAFVSSWQNPTRRANAFCQGTDYIRPFQGNNHPSNETMSRRVSVDPDFRLSRATHQKTSLPLLSSRPKWRDLAGESRLKR